MKKFKIRLLQILVLCISLCMSTMDIKAEQIIEKQCNYSDNSAVYSLMLIKDTVTNDYKINLGGFPNKYINNITVNDMSPGKENICPDVYLTTIISYNDFNTTENYSITKDDMSPIMGTTSIKVPFLSVGSSDDLDKKICLEFDKTGKKKLGDALNLASINAKSLMQCTSLAVCSTTEFYKREAEYNASKAAYDQIFTDSKKYEGCKNFEEYKKTIKGIIKNVNDQLDKSTKDYVESLKSSNVSNNIIKDIEGRVEGILKGLSTVDYGMSNEGSSTTIEFDCSTFDDLMSLTADIYKYIQILAPILLIVFGSVDFAKAVISNDQDALKKATSSFVKRAMAALLIFFLPLIINVLFSMPGISDTKDRIFCEIDLSK